MTLANWERFGLEFHLRSSPFSYSGFLNISPQAEFFTACYTVLKRHKKFDGCNLAFSLSYLRSISIASLFISRNVKVNIDVINGFPGEVERTHKKRSVQT